MELMREYRNTISFKAFDKILYILESNQNYSYIKKIDLLAETILWQQEFENYIYDFFELNDRMYATLGNEPQKTFVLDCSTGKIIDDNYKAVFHLPIFSKNNEKFICFASYNGENVDLRFTKDLSELEVVNRKDVNVSRRLDENFFLNIQKEIFQVYEYEKSKMVFQINLLEVISNIYAPTLIAKPIVYSVELFVDTVIVGINDLRNFNRYLFGITLEKGKIKWHLEGYSNFEIFKGKLYNIEFYGLFRILNPETGEIEKEIDLKDEFERYNINCEHRFNVTESHIYFKHAIKGKFGILNLNTLKMEDVHQLPDGNTMSTEEYPVLVGKRLYVRSAPQNNLFIYE